MSKPQKIILAGILLIAAFLLFFRLTRHDMLGDDAHYAFRSIGYFDFMASVEQTTPAQWFGYRPFWSMFSFHDHPPLYFLLQFLVFKIFGISVFAARLPSALAALFSVLVLFKLGRLITGSVKAGLLAAAALSVNNYFIWTGRIGLLESVFIFFFLLGLYYFVKGLSEDSRHLLKSSLFWGLSLLTKYTFLFFVPGLAVYLLWRQRQLFRNAKLWQGIFIFILLASPIIIYNLAMYQSRGHFDVQFGDLFGQAPTDWSNLGGRVKASGFNPAAVLTALIEGFSWPYFAFFSLSLLWAAWRKKHFLPILLFASVFFGFSLVGGAARWLGVFAPLAALFMGLMFYDFSQSSLFAKFKFGIIPLGALAAAFSSFYLLNTNHLKKPVGGERFYAGFRAENVGYNELDKKISAILDLKRPRTLTAEAVRLWWYKDFRPEAVNFGGVSRGMSEFNSVIIYDSATEWFSTLWIFERQKFYRRFLTPTVEEYLKIIRSESDNEVLRSLNLEGAYFIQSAPSVVSRSEIKSPETEEILAENFKAQGIAPEIIYNDRGEEAFYFYHGSFK